MKVSAVLTQVRGMWVAECEEVDRTGEGRTPDEALACLRQALEEYFEVEAVAPPSQTEAAPIEIVVVSPSASAAPITR
jgi:predicted RNase H-like HicB family nuclease